jgi:uncharacterized RDD family membrane protein YckC
MTWYYSEQGQQLGPVDQNAFDELVASGRIQPTTLVWNSEMPDWKPLSEVAPAPGPTAFCGECGKEFPTGEMLKFGATPICANCKDVFAHKLREGVSLGEVRRYGGFWIRALAQLIDGIISFIFLFIVNAALFRTFDFLGRDRPTAAILVEYLAGVAYVIWFVHRYGGTLGKLALGLRIITTRGTRLDLGESVGRYFGIWLSSITLGVGFIMAAFDSEKRALHDRVCNTRVVRV